jgi:hypothetical protein
MTILEAQNVAAEFTRKLNHQKTDFTFGITNPRSFQKYFYFDFALVILSKPETKIDVDGASGVVIDKKTIQARAITLKELRLLESNQNELERIYEFIMKSNDPNDLVFLKKMFQLATHEFVQFQQDILKNKGDKEQTLNVIQKLLDSQSNGS